MLTASKVKIGAGSEKKKKTNMNTAKPLVSTYDISFVRYVTKTFLRCSRAKELQINVKKVCCTCKVVFFVVVVVFFLFC